MDENLELIKRIRNGDDEAFKALLENHKKMIYKRLNRFMKELSSEDKQILELRGDELSYKEIADLLHISTKKIDNRLRILRKRMGQYLKDEK